MKVVRISRQRHTVCESRRRTFIAEGEDTSFITYVSTAFMTSISDVRAPNNNESRLYVVVSTRLNLTPVVVTGRSASVMYSRVLMSCSVRLPLFMAQFCEIWTFVEHLHFESMLLMPTPTCLRPNRLHPSMEMKCYAHWLSSLLALKRLPSSRLPNYRLQHQWHFSRVKKWRSNLQREGIL